MATKKEEIHNDETGIITEDELREALSNEKEAKQPKKECFFKRLFKKKEKESK